MGVLLGASGLLGCGVQQDLGARSTGSEGGIAEACDAQTFACPSHRPAEGSSCCDPGEVCIYADDGGFVPTACGNDGTWSTSHAAPGPTSAFAEASACQPCPAAPPATGSACGGASSYCPQDGGLNGFNATNNCVYCGAKVLTECTGSGWSPCSTSECLATCGAVEMDVFDGGVGD